MVVLKELKQVKLQLEEEVARNSEQEKARQREINKLKEDLEEEKLQKRKLDLQLEEEVANNKEITRLKEELAEGTYRHSHNTHTPKRDWLTNKFIVFIRKESAPEYRPQITTRAPKYG